MHAAMYFVAVATLAALVGQHIVRRVIIVLGRASLIIFVLAFVLSVNLVALGECVNPLPFCVDILIYVVKLMVNLMHKYIDLFYFGIIWVRGNVRWNWYIAHDQED